MPKLETATRVLFLLHLALGTCSAFGICTGNCGKKIFKCQCGPSPGPVVDIPIEQCTFFYKWKPYCHAAIDGDRVKEEDVCPKFRQCQTCAHDGGSCATCPPGKYGTFCDAGCQCLNGGRCLDQGENCICPPGFQGQRCQTKTVCQCLNGGRCLDQGETCICPPGFQGQLCETKTGCPYLQLAPQLTVVRTPEVNPQYMNFSCPSGYLLEGSSILTCLTEINQWSHPAPTCVPACTVPRAPENGWMDKAPVDSFLVKSGQALEFRCSQGYALTGASKTICTADRTWSDEVPICTPVSFCREPQPVLYATYEYHTPAAQPKFSNGTRVVFTCLDGHLLFGQSQLICGQDGRWSSNTPVCVKVFESEVDCFTNGSEVVEETEKPVRIHCPPGCASENASVWGTVIYESSSSVCRAAVHSGRISDSLGGSLFVVNNGPYNDFLSSFMNGVESKRKNLISESFRFHHDPDLELQNQNNPDKGCPWGWTEFQGHCLYVATKPQAWGAAKTICSNMGSRLPNLSNPGLIKEVLRSKGADLQSFWLLSKSNGNVTSTVLPLWAGLDFKLNPNITPLLVEQDQEDLLQPEDFSCNLVSQRSGRPLWTLKPCSDASSFVCDIDLNQYRVGCEERDLLENGFVVLQDPERGFRRGSVIIFQCKELHVLQGEASSTCLPNATWSAPLPSCKRIPACLEPPTINFGSVNILGPNMQTNSRIGWRGTGIRTRGNRRGRTISLRHFRSSQNETNLPAGHYREGTRAFYTCESKYYYLAGSKTRTCQKDSTWSGTTATCIPVCGQSDSPRTPFITKGNATDVGQWPWQIGLSHEGNSFILCGASLLNEFWIVTAAHCVVDELTALPLKPETIIIYAGKYHRDDVKDDDFVQIRKGATIHVHPNYDPSTYDSDIALVRMDSKVTFNSRIRPICLPTDRSTLLNLIAGKKGVVTGWGLNELSVYTDTLQQAVLPVVSHEDCEKGYEAAGLPLTVTENMFCAGLNEGQTDTCSGDSGGPMVFQLESGNIKRWFLEGIVSWGSLAGCGNPQQYGGFTKVHRFLDWIEENI